ncbi:MAG TPA: PAS domain S-box protein [Mucilaginibacter sp.]|jgi:PAS domain S-box-containing protein
MKQAEDITSSINKYQFLVGGGEMAALTRDKDWSETPVGDPETWPQSLKTTLGIILNSKFPMFLWWGPELICFYNDAYRPSLGRNGKHPFILGMPAKEAWPEIWDIIKPLIDQVLSGGEATWNEDALIPIYRNGKIRDVYWTFSYSPVHDESGNVAGVLVICNETTEKVNTWDYLEEDKEQLQSAIEAAELATWDLNPITNKLSGNSRLFEWLGLPVGREFDLQQAINAIAKKDRQRIINDLQRVLEYSSGGRYETICSIIQPQTRKETIVKAIGKAWFGPDKKAYRFSGVLHNVTEQVIAQRKIEESEERFRTMAEATDILIAVDDGTGNATYFNKAWTELSGRPMEDLLKFGWMDLIHPEDRKAFVNIYLSAFEKKAPFKVELRMMSKSGQYRWMLKKWIPRFRPDRTFEGYITSCIDITERKLAEEEIKRFKFMTDNASDPFILADKNGRFEYLNKSTLDKWGYTAEEAKYLTVKDIDVFYTKEEFTDVFNRAQNDVIPLLETVHKKKDNSRYPAELSVTGLVLGGEQYLFTIVRDISERKKTEQALKDSEQRLNLVIRASELGTWELSFNSEETICSDRFLEIFGHKNRTGVTALLTIKQIHPDDVVIRDKAIELAIATGVLHYQARIIWLDTSIHWIEVKGNVFYDEMNRPLRMIGTARDITEEKRHQLNLAEREEKFRLLADSIPQLVWTADAKGNLNYFNKSVIDYSGLSLKQIIKGGWMQMVHPDDVEENINAWADAVKTGDDFLSEHRFRRFDGEYRWQLSRAIPQKDAEGHIQMWVGSSTDIQQIKEQEQQKDYFVSLASHELKTPITSMKGYVQLLKRKYDDSNDPFLKKSLTVIDKQIATLIGLISELLDISKIKSGKLHLKKEPFEINGLIREVIEEVSHIRSDFEILFPKEKDLLINADRDRIGQVLTNFLTNAIKYSPDSNLVEVSTKVEAGNVTVSVKDDGIGIGKQDQERIFDRFFRVQGKNEKNFPGFGIGLFIASEIVHRHHGKIGVNSKPGKGSIFYFSIPVDK